MIKAFTVQANTKNDLMTTTEGKKTNYIHYFSIKHVCHCYDVLSNMTCVSVEYAYLSIYHLPYLVLNYYIYLLLSIAVPLLM